ncbi:MAG: phosphoribosylformylglycinamidine synthase subunit PurS [Candidatus Delongbacteria bacterium]|jgi:phosphoribosylformylglycinamidine synthase PurS subunit|nr:phosphoribosylformylglycinamidine synthase subunit PurS [Candidatus Delongbacteria bacterium]
MKFIAEINVMPQKALLDPQGKTVNNLMHNMGYKSVKNLRMGKHIRFEIEAVSEKDAKAKVENTCNKVLANPVMEEYEYTLKKA